MIKLLTDRAAPAPAWAVPEELQEHYRGLLRRLPWPGGGPPEVPRALGVTGCESGAGASTLAASLAVTAAACGLGPVALVDANLERPAAHRLLGVSLFPGLDEALADRALPPAVQRSPVADVAVLAAGGTGAGTARAWAAGALAKLLDGLKAEFALLVVDLPPADHAGFVPPLAGLLDGALLVVEAERTRGEAARRQKDLLAAAGARLLGAVLNKNRRFL